MFLNALYGEINLAHCFFTSFQSFVMRLPEINFAGNDADVAIDFQHRQFYIGKMFHSMLPHRFL